MDDFTPSTESAPSLEDTGTRAKHYGELLDNWSDGLEILLRKKEYWRSDREKEQIVQLTAGIDLLKKTMVGSRGDYDEYQYARVINRLPKAEKAEEIEGK